MLTDCRIHATIPASDLGRARKWYADKLGFEHVRQLPGGLMYDAADTTRFIIYPTPNAGKSPNSGHVRPVPKFAAVHTTVATAHEVCALQPPPRVVHDHSDIRALKKPIRRSNFAPGNGFTRLPQNTR